MLNQTCTFFLKAFDTFSLGLPAWLGVKNPPANAGDAGSIPGLGRPPGQGNGNPLQHSCPRNPTDRGAWRVTVHGGLKESDTAEPLNNNIGSDCAVSLGLTKKIQTSIHSGITTEQGK